MTRIAHALFFTSLALVGLAGCQSPIQEDEDLPVATKTWAINGNAYQFYTNDTGNYNYWFSNPFSNNDTSAVFAGFTGVAKKVSGAGNQGFGFRFCQIDANNYYRILIDINGYYQVGKMLSGSWTTLKEWTFSSSLHTGLKVENEIKVSRSGYNFYVYFNGTYIGYFYDSSLNKDSFATLATVGDKDNENFPNNPEDVRIRFTSPDTLPAVAKSLLSPGWVAESRDQDDATSSSHR